VRDNLVQNNGANNDADKQEQQLAEQGQWDHRADGFSIKQPQLPHSAALLPPSNLRGLALM